MKRYWIDASSVIWCNRELFPLRDSPKYWEWFKEQLDQGNIVTHKAVFDEIVKGADGEKPDAIAVWTKSRKGMWSSHGCTDESRKLLGEISAFCLGKYGYEVSKKFLTGGDALLIARAKVDRDDFEGIVVTQESEHKDPRIPGICDHFEIEHMPLNRMNIKLGLKWV